MNHILYGTQNLRSVYLCAVFNVVRKTLDLYDLCAVFNVVRKTLDLYDFYGTQNLRSVLLFRFCRNVDRKGMSARQFRVTVLHGEDVLVEHLLPDGNTIVLDGAACARKMNVPSRFLAFATSAGVELQRTANGSSFEFNIPTAWSNVSQAGLLVVSLEVYLAGEGHDDPSSWFGDSGSEKEEEANKDSYEVAGITFEDPAMQERYNYLTKNSYPPTMQTAEQKKNFRRECKRSYTLSIEGHLMFLGNLKRPTRVKKHACRAYVAHMHLQRRVVPTRSEMMAIVDTHHQKTHDDAHRVENGLNMHYMYHSLLDVIKENRANCARCQEYERVPKTTQAIISSYPFEIVMMDLFFLPMDSDGGETCVLLLKDHFTKYHWARAFKGKHMGPIAAYLLEIFMDGNVPERLHCDNGNEFVNQCVKEVNRLLNMSSYSQGKTRHPQTQGLIERANGTVKMKILKKCCDLGYTMPGQTFDWASKLLAEIIRLENDAPIKLYANVSAFIAMHGIPRLGGTVVRPSPTALETLYTKMHECQLARAFKRGQFPVLEDLSVGTVVNVLASAKELKDNCAISSWSARGIIHQMSPMSEHAYSVRWLSKGLHARRCKRGHALPLDPGTLSPYYTRVQLKRVVNAEPASVQVTEHGVILVVHTFDDFTCNYVYLTGEYMGAHYNTAEDNVTGLETMTYAVFAQGEQTQGDSHDGETKEETDEVRYKKWAMREPGGNAYNQARVDDCTEWFNAEDPQKAVPEYIKKRRKTEKAARARSKKKWARARRNVAGLGVQGAKKVSAKERSLQGTKAPRKKAPKMKAPKKKAPRKNAPKKKRKAKQSILCVLFTTFNTVIKHDSSVFCLPYFMRTTNVTNLFCCISGVTAGPAEVQTKGKNHQYCVFCLPHLIR